MTMWLLETRREELADRLRQALRGELSHLHEVDGPDFASKSQNLYLLWKKLPQKERFLPSTLIVGDGQKRDLLAWLGTYLPTLRPFTHLVRVVEQGSYRQIVERGGQNTSKRYIAGAVGLVIAEAVSRQEGGRPLTYDDCLETFSFAFARALFSGATVAELKTVSAAWTRAHRASRYRLVSGGLERLIGPCAILAALSDRTLPGYASLMDSEIYSVAYELGEHGRISPSLKSDLAKSVALPEHLIEATAEGTRESRVQALEGALSSIAKSKDARPSIATFIAGYLVSQVAPGSFEYLSLMTSLAEARSETVLWYGLLVGLHPDTNVLDYEKGLGWCVAAELMRSSEPWDRPIADMDVDEFEMLLTSDRPNAGQRSLRGRLSIELMAGSETTVSVGPLDIRRSESQPELFESERMSIETGRLLNDINSAMRHLHQIRSQLERISGKPYSPDSSKRRK